MEIVDQHENNKFIKFKYLEASPVITVLGFETS